MSKKNIAIHEEEHKKLVDLVKVNVEARKTPATQGKYIEYLIRKEHKRVNKS